jgi:hypothetical protein
MKKIYLLAIIVVLLSGDEAADKAKLDAKHLPDQGAAPSKEGCLVGQRSGGLGHDVRVVIIPGVQSHLRVEPVEPTEKVVSAPLWSGWSRLQDPEAGMIQSFYLLVSFFINLFVTLDSMLQKKTTGVEPHYLDTWLLVHDDDEARAEKLVSNNIKCYA